MDVVESSSETNRDEVRLIEKVNHLAVSDKRRYLEKISVIGKDPYCIPSSKLSKDHRYFISIPVRGQFKGKNWGNN